METAIQENSFEKLALAERAAELTTAKFIESRIVPLIQSQTNGNGAPCRCEVVQNTGTGRLTIRYEFGPEYVFFGKVYADGLGSRCYEVNRALWENGFNSAAQFRVPQPLAFLEEHKLLLMHGVSGTALGAAFEGNRQLDLVAGSRAAARCLAALHRCPLQSGTADADWESLKLFRMAARLTKAAASRPERLETIRELMHLLERRIEQLPAKRRLLFTHGRYHHDHVFLSAEATSVIDLDRCCLADPAKDAAEFIRVLRLTAFKKDFDMALADEATSAFLNTYLAEVPEAAASLGCYWAAFVFHSLLGSLKKMRAKGTRTAEEVIEFFTGEMLRALDFSR